MTNPTSAIVPIKSTFWSKINWTQVIALAASFGTVYGIELDAQTQVAIVLAFQSTGAVITWILKTFFTGSVTSQSLPS